MSDRPEEGDLAEQLRAARARVTRLEQELESSRALLTRALMPAPPPPPPPAKLGVLHGLAFVAGLVCGVLLVLAVLATRARPAEPARAPAPVVEVTVDAGAVADQPPVVEEIDAGVEPPAAAPVPEPAVDAGAPSKPSPRPAPPARPKAQVTPDDSGALNLSSTPAAEVFVDGKKVGITPLRGHPVAPGPHTVRFVCAGGSAERKVTVPAFAEVDVEHRCE